MLRAARWREARASRSSGHQWFEGSASRPPYPAGIAIDSGRGRVSPRDLCGLSPNPPQELPATHPYGTARPLYRPPHEYRAPGGLAAAEEGETQPRTLALGEGDTNEQDYTYTRATRALFSRRLTNEETGGGPLMDIIDRGDKGSLSERMSQFLEI
jgi:hypothetical protein